MPSFFQLCCWFYPLAMDYQLQSEKAMWQLSLVIKLRGSMKSFLPVFDEAVRKSMTKMTIESNETVKLNFIVNNPKPRPDLEARMLELVNEERAKEGLSQLVADTALTHVARVHSTDMFARGYFAHVSPEGTTPADRVRSAGIRFLITGENLALGPTLKICHTGLMNSPGHRANILHKSYGRVGIGVMDGGLRGLMISQEFKN